MHVKINSNYVLQVFINKYKHLCVCVCVRVCERKREREREGAIMDIPIHLISKPFSFDRAVGSFLLLSVLTLHV